MTREEWKALVIEWLESGQGCTDFALANGVKPKQLSWWKWRLTTDGEELQLRQEVVGRKNWLFLGSEDGGKWNTTFVSLIASCKLHGLEPWSYLRDLLCLLPSWNQKRVLELAPAYWKQTLEQSDAQELLAQNVFRPITLGDSANHHETR